MRLFGEMEKHYCIKFYIDERDGNKVIGRINNGMYEIDDISLNAALMKLFSDITYYYDYKKIFIGISYVICDDVFMGISYKNKVIYDNNLLREYFYC